MLFRSSAGTHTAVCTHALSHTPHTHAYTLRCTRTPWLRLSALSPCPLHRSPSAHFPSGREVRTPSVSSRPGPSPVLPARRRRSQALPGKVGPTPDCVHTAFIPRVWAPDRVQLTRGLRTRREPGEHPCAERRKCRAWAPPGPPPPTHTRALAPRSTQDQASWGVPRAEDRPATPFTKRSSLLSSL